MRRLDPGLEGVEGVDDKVDRERGYGSSLAIGDVSNPFVSCLVSEVLIMPTSP